MTTFVNEEHFLQKNLFYIFFLGGEVEKKRHSLYPGTQRTTTEEPEMSYLKSLHGKDQQEKTLLQFLGKGFSIDSKIIPL